jgi:RNA polymerase sigma-70 factor (sigma-E family)
MENRVDNEEFANFASEVGGRLHNLALALCGSRADAEDLVQTTLERLYRAWRPTTPDDPVAYARTVLVRTHISDRRRPRWKREWSTPQPDEVTTGETGAADRRVVLQQALAQLPKRQRQAVVLRYLEDLPIAEVAQLMRCGQGNVKRCAHDGLNGLRALLESEHQQGARR